MLDERHREALTALQEQARLAAELVVFDWSDPNRHAEGERLKGDMAAVQERMGRYPRECSRIIQIALDSDDPELSIPELTPERLFRLLGG